MYCCMQAAMPARSRHAHACMHAGGPLCARMHARTRARMHASMPSRAHAHATGMHTNAPIACPHMHACRHAHPVAWSPHPTGRCSLGPLLLPLNLPRSASGGPAPGLEDGLASLSSHLAGDIDLHRAQAGVPHEAVPVPHRHLHAGLNVHLRNRAHTSAFGWLA